jgi:CRP-like cAMP-binding protein
MSVLHQSSVTNHLLTALSPSDFALLQSHLEPVDLQLRQHVFRAGEPMNHVVFPDSGVVSIIADIEEGRFEVGMTGWEGLAGVPVLLGVTHTPHTALVQVPGTGWRLAARQLRDAMDESTTLTSLLLRYVHTFIVQVSQTAFANAGYPLEARLGRWILMTHDRTEGDNLGMTHEFMATMLGTGRSGVTFAVQTLEGNGLIRATRGRITVRNREGLEALAGDAYGLAEREYTNVLQFPLKKPAQQGSVT